MIRLGHFLLPWLLLLPLAAAASLIQPDSIPNAPEDAADNPCNLEDPGFGAYHAWQKLGQEEEPELGQILIPRQLPLKTDGGFDLIIHFHGGNAARKQMVGVAQGLVLVGVDLGAGSRAYERPFSDPSVFPRLLAAAEAAVAERSGQPRARVRKLALSAWSAGYGAIRAILRQRASERVDSVVLIDGLHADFDEDHPHLPNAEQMEPFLHFAQKAAKRSRYMFVSHSRIIPPGYASTTLTAHYLTRRVGGKISPSVQQDSPYLKRYERARQGDFSMRGHHGEGKGDHCAQLALIGEVSAYLQERWQPKPPPKPSKAKPKPNSNKAKPSGRPTTAQSSKPSQQAAGT
ncbi:MAG: hypothetical protein HQL47_02885 [Gammaproteobacteria bacterium]|nr:hypothetical protein [Gammaproteobacteria bacterium]